MTTEDSTLREVDQELAEERQFEMIRRYGPMIAIFAIACVLGVAINQFLGHQKRTKAEAGASSYQAALTILSDDLDRGQEKLKDIEENGPAGYAVLAAFRQASIYANQGDTPRAHTQYRAIVERENISPHIKDLARIRSAYLSLDVGGLDAVKSDLGDLPAGKTPFSYYAREAIALAQLSDKNYDAAIAEFDALSSVAGVPERLKARAAEFAVVARAGKSGANITGEARVDDLLERLGDIPDTIGAPVVENNDTHGQVEGEAEAEGGAIEGEVIDVPPALIEVSPPTGATPAEVIEKVVDETAEKVENGLTP